MPREVERELAAEPVSFDELLARSEILSLHVPVTPQTQSWSEGRP